MGPPDVLELAEGDDGNTTGDSFVLGRDQRKRVKVPLRGAAETIRRHHPRMAIASEHLPDDVTAIPRTVNAIWSGYHVRPSSCKDAFLSITPEVLLFQPES